MKRPVKIGLGIVAAVVVLLFVAVFVVLSRIDGIVEQTVESQGTSQLNLQTLLSDADVSLFGGSVALNGLTIANPEGYSAEHLFEMGQVRVGVGLTGLTGDPLRIGEIDINSPALTIERGSVGGMAEQLRLNLQELMERLATDPDAETTMLLIDRLTVTNARVAIRPNIEGLDEEYALTLPDITLREIGTAEGAQNGAEIGRVVADVAMALAKKAAESEDLPPEVRAVLSGDLSAILSKYGDELSNKVREELNDQLDGLGDKVGGEAGKAIDDVLQGAAGDGANVRDKAEDAARDGIKKGIGGLFGGDKKENDKKDQ